MGICLDFGSDIGIVRSEEDEVIGCLAAGGYRAGNAGKGSQVRVS